MDSSKIEVVMGVNDSRRSYGGITPKVIGKFEDKKVMIKGGGFEEVIMEFFAAKLGKTLGIKINNVELINTGDVLGLSKYCSVHWWEDRFVTSSDAYKQDKWQLKDNEHDIMRFFDIIINNGDRHSGNYGFKNKSLFLIDNGNSTPWHISIRDWEVRDMQRILKSNDPQFLKVVEKFLSITPRKIKYMLKLPKTFQDTYSAEKVEMVIKRFLAIKEKINKELELKKQNGGTAC